MKKCTHLEICCLWLSDILAGDDHLNAFNVVLFFTFDYKVNKG